MQKRLQATLSVPVYGILYIYTAAGVVLILALAFLRMRKIISMLTCFWARSVFFIMGKRFEISGKEYIEKDSKYILLANHGSLFDITAIMSFYPDVSWFGHERLLKIPLFRRILIATNYIPYRTPTVGNTRRMIEQLKHNALEQSIAIFPEGTRTLDGQINGFYRGFIYLLRSSDHNILPITLNGFYNLKPKNRFSINFSSDLEVIIHEPIDNKSLRNLTDDEIINTIREIIETAYKN